MKRILALVLLACMILSLFGCGAGQTATTEATETLADPYAGQFRVGYARKLITPKELGLPLAGYGNTSTRLSERVLDDQYATCVAISDEDNNTVLIVGMDIIQVNEVVLMARDLVVKEFGIPKENIIINATHTHSCAVMDAPGNDKVDRYKGYVVNQFRAAVEAALADRKPVTMAEVGDIETEELNFIRHYELENGTYAGDSFGDFSSAPIKCHTAEADHTMHLIRFTREEGKAVVLVNWRAHPTMTGWGSSAPANDVSADYIHPFRQSVELMQDCKVVFLQGAAGNVNATSRIDSERIYSEDYMAHGHRLAEFANEALNNNMHEVSLGKVRNSQRVLDMEINHSTDDILIAAKTVAAVWSTTNNRALAIETGAPYGIRSPYHPNAIVSRAAMGKTQDVEINAIAIGDSIGFTTAPAEIFDRNSMAVEEGSPFEMTFVLGYTNAHRYYIPSAYVYEYTSYETDTTRFIPGTAETIEQNMLEMLHALAE